MTPPLPHSLYRTYLKNLRHVPDPHVWKTHQPYFRSLAEKARGTPGLNSPPVSIKQDDTEAPSSDDLAAYAREGRRVRALTRAKEELKKLRAATACHPHAFRRLLEESYGLRGRVRWEIINNIVRSNLAPNASPVPIPDPPLPTPLIPLKPKIIVPPNNLNRLRPLPDVAIRKAAHRAAERDWREVVVPLILPPNAEGWATGREGMGIMESVRLQAGFDVPPTPSSSDTTPSPDASPPRPLPRDLPTYANLPPHIRLLIPRLHPEPLSREIGITYPRPRPGETRNNPSTWGPPRVLRTRLIRRMYQRLWGQLRWVKMSKNGQWEECRYEDMGTGGESVGMKKGRG